MKDKNIIRKLRKYFKENEDVSMAFLFGSYAEERAGKISDIDIAIWIKGGFNFEKYTEIKSNIEVFLGKEEIDLVPFDKTSPTVAAKALMGIPIVIKNKSFYLEYMLKTLKEAEDYRNFIFSLWKTRRKLEKSNPLDEEHRERLIKRVTFIESELVLLEEYKDITFDIYKQNIKTRRLVERSCELIANACIDASRIFIASERAPVPLTYQDTFFKLGEMKIADFPLAKSLAELARVRNILAHEYLEELWKDVKNTIDKIPKIKEFLEIIKKKIDEL